MGLFCNCDIKMVELEEKVEALQKLLKDRVEEVESKIEDVPVGEAEAFFCGSHGFGYIKNRAKRVPISEAVEFLFKHFNLEICETEAIESKKVIRKKIKKKSKKKKS